MSKEYILAAQSAEAMQEWVRILKNQKIIAIKQSMGHVPVSEDDRFANAVGANGLVLVLVLVCLIPGHTALTPFLTMNDSIITQSIRLGII